MEDNDINQIAPGVHDEGEKKTNQEGNEEDINADPFSSIDAAINHGIAKRVYFSKKDDPKLEKCEPCPCCQNPIGGKLIPLWCDLRKIYHLGSGFALYFRFIKSVIAMLLIVFCISGIYNIISNRKTGDCDPNISAEANDGSYCIQGYILTYSIPNKRDHEHQLFIQQILNLVSVVVIMVYFHYIRYRFRDTEIEADDETITPSDYTCVFENIDPNSKESEFRQWLIDLAKKDNMDLKIMKVNKGYAITQFIALRNRETALVKKKNALKRKATKTQKEETEYIDVDTELTDVRKQLNEVRTAKLKRSTYLFVTFSTAVESDYIQKKFQRSLFTQIFEFFKPAFINTARSFGGVSVKAHRAPEPTDILWENLGYTTKEKYKRRAITTFLTFLFVCISLGIILLVNWGQNKAIDKWGKTSKVVQGLNVVVSLLVTVTNSILAMLIDVLSRQEKHVTYTNYLKGVAQKLSVAQFLNTALISLFVELILAEDPDNTGLNRLQLINFYGKGGLLENIYWIFITSNLIPPVMTIFDPNYILKRVMQWRVTPKKGVPRDGKELKMSQKEANTLFEGPPITMPTKYAGMIKVLLLTTFYAPALPFSMIYTIAGLSIYYWAEKYVLLRRIALPNMVGDELADEMVEYAEWAACTFAVGNIIFVYTLKNTAFEYSHNDASFAVAWVIFGVSLVHIFFPMELLNKTLFPIEDLVTEYKSYDEVRVDFNTDYNVENPITHHKGFKEMETIKRRRAAKGKSPAKEKEASNIDLISKLGPGDAPTTLFPRKLASDQEQPRSPEEAQEGQEVFESEEDYYAYDDEDDEVNWSELEKFADQPKTVIAPNEQAVETNPEAKPKSNINQYGTFLSGAFAQPTGQGQEEKLKNAVFGGAIDENGPLNVESTNSPIDLMQIAANVQDGGESNYQTRERDYEQQGSMNRNHQTQESERPLKSHNRRATNQSDHNDVENQQAYDNQQARADETDSRVERNVEFDPSAVELIGGTFSPDRRQSQQISRIEDNPKDKLGRFGVRSPDTKLSKIDPKENVEAGTPSSINNFSKDEEL